MSMEAENQVPKGSNRKLIAVIVIFILALLVLVVTLTLALKPEENTPPTETSPVEDETQLQTEIETEEPTQLETEAPTEPQMLPHMAELHEQNQDIAGWMTIADTVVDYPVMYTPDDREKYLHRDFDGSYDFAGELFIDEDCSLDPESDNLIIYGHNMKNGTMFRTIMSYRKQTFWQDHRTFTFTTLYEERTYEVVAAFYDRVYYKHEDVFKFYQFIDAGTEAEFNEAISYYRENACFDTGIVPEYGDRLLTLVTCTSYTDDGRFVVIAREVPEETTEETTAEE